MCVKKIKIKKISEKKRWSVSRYSYNPVFEYIYMFSIWIYIYSNILVFGKKKKYIYIYTPFHSGSSMSTHTLLT